MLQVKERDLPLKIREMLERVKRGEEVTIVENNVPVARIVPPGNSTRIPRLGTAEGQVHLTPDFDSIPEEFAEYL